MMKKKSYFRPEVDALSGYVPGEQPRMTGLVKLNTNENPYPPSPRIRELLRDFDIDRLRLYSAPAADELCEALAAYHGVSRNMVIAGNGSDDILTMLFRAFTDGSRPLACTDPTYSLYSVLAAMQGAPVIKVSLDPETFAMPSGLLEQVRGANMLVITRPNAPTGNTFPMADMVKICDGFDGIVVIDEAYADFAEDNCIELAKSRSNVVICRTFSKSYSLAGLRLGYAVAHPDIIEGMMKLKDSYNVDAFAQAAGLVAFQDRAYFESNVEKVKSSRESLRRELAGMGFRITDSHTNFLFAMPPDGDGEGYFKALRENAVIVRYFPGEVTGRYVRITVGTPEQMQRLLEVTRQYLNMPPTG